MMRRNNGDRWDTYRPLTNVMVQAYPSPSDLVLTFNYQWLHYLILKLLHGKKLRPPATPTSSAASTTRTTEHECYRRLLAIERILSTCLAAQVPPRSETKRKLMVAAVSTTKSDPAQGPSSASELISLAVKQGWQQKASSLRQV
jgi:serine/threonine-protein kinase haspin